MACEGTNVRLLRMELNPIDHLHRSKQVNRRRCRWQMGETHVSVAGEDPEAAKSASTLRVGRCGQHPDMDKGMLASESEKRDTSNDVEAESDGADLVARRCLELRDQSMRRGGRRAEFYEIDLERAS